MKNTTLPDLIARGRIQKAIQSMGLDPDAASLHITTSQVTVTLYVRNRNGGLIAHNNELLTTDVVIPLCSNMEEASE